MQQQGKYGNKQCEYEKCENWFPFNHRLQKYCSNRCRTYASFTRTRGGVPTLREGLGIAIKENKNDLKKFNELVSTAKRENINAVNNGFDVLFDKINELSDRLEKNENNHIKDVKNLGINVIANEVTKVLEKLFGNEKVTLKIFMEEINKIKKNQLTIFEHTKKTDEQKKADKKREEFNKWMDDNGYPRNIKGR